METPLFFKNDDYNLFGMLHEAKKNIVVDEKLEYKEDHVGIIICSPFAEEKLISHRVLVNQARALANNGFLCFRFDYMGHGDSEGAFEDATVKTRLSDISAAVNFLRNEKNINKIILLGVRFGATLAALIQNENSGINSLVMINPVINGKDYIEQVLRTNLTLQMATYKKILKNREQLINEILDGKPANIDGYLLTKTMYEQMCQISLLDNFEIFVENLFVIQISNKEDKPIEKNLQTFSAQISSSIDNLELINIKENSFWKDEKFYRAKAITLETTILDWLNKIY
jgi:exosortase A-associated hydrolase 2